MSARRRAVREGAGRANGRATRARTGCPPSAVGGGDRVNAGVRTGCALGDGAGGADLAIARGREEGVRDGK
jgi:hypothetical protein